MKKMNKNYKKNKLLILFLIMSILIGNLTSVGFTIESGTKEKESVITTEEETSKESSNLVLNDEEIAKYKEEKTKEIKEKYNVIKDEYIKLKENLKSTNESKMEILFQNLETELEEILDNINAATTIEEIDKVVKEVEEFYSQELGKIKEYNNLNDSEIEGKEVENNPDNFPGSTGVKVPLIQKYTQPMLRANFNSITDSPGGEVKMSKTATPVEGMVNTWDIKVKVEGQDIDFSSDIVLLIDTSGSMRNNGRMDAAKNAAKEFADQLLTDGNVNTRIAVVSFATGVKVEQELTNNPEDVKAAINRLRADGGTFTQAGILQAEEILNNSTANLKNIVLLSDGEPTFSYGIKNHNKNLFVDPSYGLMTKSDIPKEDFYYNWRVGDGAIILSRVYSREIGRYFYYNHGNSAIAEAAFVKEAGNTVYTIALEVSQIGEDVLSNIASPGKDYFGKPEHLSKIFDEIGGEILDAATDAKVTDPMGEGFTVIGNVSNIKVSKGTTANYNEGTKTISWEIGTFSQVSEENPNIKYATMEYRVEIDDDILDAVSKDGNYSTNGETYLIYKDKDGKEQKLKVDVPSVKPILLILEKKLINSLGFEIIDKNMGEDKRIFEINGTNGKDYDKTYELVPGQKRVMTNLKYEDEYTVQESGFKGDTTHSADDYNTSYTINGKDTSKFTVKQGDSNKPIFITNTEKPLGELTVTKVFDPGVTRTKRSTTAPKFKFELIGPNKANGKSSLDGIEGLTLENGKYVFELEAGKSKTFEKLPYAEYQVVEIDSKGFVPSYSTTDGKVTLTISNKTGKVTVKNTPKDDDKTIDIEAKKIWNGGKVENHTPVDLVLIKDGLETDIKPTSIDQDKDEKNIFNYSWKGLQKYGEDGKLIEYTM